MIISVENWIEGGLKVSTEFAALLRHNDLTTADELWRRHGESVKKQRRERGTERLFLDNPGGEPVETFIKRYLPISLGERLKRLLSFRPQHADGAFHEWEAILAFHEQELPTMRPIAVGKATEGTCLLTLGITDCVRASDLFAEFAAHRNESTHERKRNLIGRIARLAAGMHGAGTASP